MLQPIKHTPDDRDDTFEVETGYCTYCGGEFKRSDLVIVFQSDVACPECLAYSKIQAEMNNELLITKPL